MGQSGSVIFVLQMDVMLQHMWNTSNVHFHVYENLPLYSDCVWCRFVWCIIVHNIIVNVI